MSRHKNSLLIVTSLVFMVAMSAVFGGLIGAPVSLFMYFLMPGTFDSFAQDLFWTSSFAAALFLTLTILGRLVQMRFEGRGYVRNTFFYDLIQK